MWFGKIDLDVRNPTKSAVICSKCNKYTVVSVLKLKLHVTLLWVIISPTRNDNIFKMTLGYLVNWEEKTIHLNISHLF